MKAAKEILKFYIVGGSGIIVNLGALYFFTEFLKLWYMASAAVGITASVTSNFYLNRMWTFRSKEKNVVNQYLKFCISCAVGVGIQIGLLYALVEFFMVWYLLAAAISIFIGSFSNFLFSKFYAFKQ